MLIAWIPLFILGLERAYSHARLPVGLDDFDPVLIFFRQKEGMCDSCFDVLVAGASIRLENKNLGNNNLRNLMKIRKFRK